MRIRQAAIVLALALTSCDGPNAGELMFDLSTPNSDDGAIQFTITATPGYEMLDLEAACAGCRVFVRRIDERTTLGIVTGPIGGGALLRAVSDLRAPVDRGLRYFRVEVEAPSTPPTNPA